MPKDLNRSQCDALSAFGFHWCATSLYLQIRPHGSRSWLFRYSRNGRAHWLGLGPAELVTLAMARKAVLALRLAVLDGRDVSAEKRAAKTDRRKHAPTFAECCAKYIADHAQGWRNAKHAAQWASTLNSYAAPMIGQLSVAEIAAEQVAGVLRPIWTTKAETARRLRGRIERVFNWSIAKGYRTGENPAAWAVLRHLLPAASGKPVKHHEARPWREVPALVADLRKRDSTSARALLFTILTAARTGEATGAVWGEIDLSLWTIPAARMKAGKYHRVPLAGPVIELLAMFPRGRSDALLFPGGKPDKPLSNMAMLELLRGMRPGAGLTVHGLRSSFRDWAAETGCARDVAETALAHAVRDKTEAAYLRTDHLDARRPLMEAWAAHCFGRKPAGITRKISLAGGRPEGADPTRPAAHAGMGSSLLRR